MWRRPSSPPDDDDDGRRIAITSNTVPDSDSRRTSLGPPSPGSLSSTPVLDRGRTRSTPPATPIPRSATSRTRLKHATVQQQRQHPQLDTAAVDRGHTLTRSPSPRHWKRPPTPTKNASTEKISLGMRSGVDEHSAAVQEKMAAPRLHRRVRMRSPWSCSLPTLVTTVLSSIVLFIIVHSFVTRQIDNKGCRMSYMRPAFAKLEDFDTEHTRFASKYSVYLYREGGIDEDPEVKGVPVLFIPGNAGSYKQVRPIAAEAAQYYHEVVQHDSAALKAGTSSLDFFTADFNEDITAAHGRTLLDQAEYLNEAVAYILSLYHDPKRTSRNPDLPDPSSVIILGHSMGGIVARAMLTMPNYQSSSINTIITMSAPHARPPISFDADIVRTYSQINDYWRSAYAERWANNNPLWPVTLISIAGGGLDTVVPSDYASLDSLVPDTNGFTVFSSSVPDVWTGMDHQSILWCDQFRKVIVKSLTDVVDVKRSSQTKPRADRMRIFRKWYLTGMESSEKAMPQREPTTLLTLEDSSHSVVTRGKTLTLRNFGKAKKAQAHLLPVPAHGTPGGDQFTLLSNVKLDAAGGNGKLEVLFCSVFPLQQAGPSSSSAAAFAHHLDLSAGGETKNNVNGLSSTRLACKNPSIDAIDLPASTRTSKFPFDEGSPPFSYLQYSYVDIAEHQFVAIIDKAGSPAVEASEFSDSANWVTAEFSSSADSVVDTDVSLTRLLTSGLTVHLPPARPLVTDIKIPALHSSLLAYHLSISSQHCGGGENNEDGSPPVLFAPLLRQYLLAPYESKYFVNVHGKPINVNLHGIAPFMPPPLQMPERGQSSAARHSKHDDNHPSRARGSKPGGVSLQLWTDPTCNSSMTLSLEVDVLGSLGKLVMRYRTVFAAFPLLIVALVLRTQFKHYDATGDFISFGQGVDLTLRRSLPLTLLALSAFAITLSWTSPSSAIPSSATSSTRASSPLSPHRNQTSTSPPSYSTSHDLLLGSGSDSFFFLLLPLITGLSVAMCVGVNYAALVLTSVLSWLYGNLLAVWSGLATSAGRRPSISPSSSHAHNAAGFAASSPRRRMVTTTVLLVFVATVIPYQFAYMVACLVQVATCTRALRCARETRSNHHASFNNYAHSILILMLWVLPINLPVLVVWIHNLAVHWLTPFSSHHNVLSIMPFILLVETLAGGKMIPRLTTGSRHLTPLLLLGLGLYAAVYGVTYAYRLHHLVNLFAAWLVAVHFSASGTAWLSLRGLTQLLEGGDPLDDDDNAPDGAPDSSVRERKKTP